MKEQVKRTQQLMQTFAQLPQPEPPYYKIYTDYFHESNFIDVHPVCTAVYFDWLLCYASHKHQIDVTATAPLSQVAQVRKLDKFL